LHEFLLCHVGALTWIEGCPSLLQITAACSLPQDLGETLEVASLVCIKLAKAKWTRAAIAIWSQLPPQESSFRAKTKRSARLGEICMGYPTNTMVVKVVPPRTKCSTTMLPKKLG
jgi:hypothetical protein